MHRNRGTGSEGTNTEVGHRGKVMGRMEGQREEKSGREGDRQGRGEQQRDRWTESKERQMERASNK